MKKFLFICCLSLAFVNAKGLPTNAPPTTNAPIGIQTDLSNNTTNQPVQIGQSGSGTTNVPVPIPPGNSVNTNPPPAIKIPQSTMMVDVFDRIVGHTNFAKANGLATADDIVDQISADAQIVTITTNLHPSIFITNFEYQPYAMGEYQYDASGSSNGLLRYTMESAYGLCEILWKTNGVVMFPNLTVLFQKGSDFSELYTDINAFFSSRGGCFGSHYTTNYTPLSSIQTGGGTDTNLILAAAAANASAQIVAAAPNYVPKTNGTAENLMVKGNFGGPDASWSIAENGSGFFGGLGWSGIGDFYAATLAGSGIYLHDIPSTAITGVFPTNQLPMDQLVAKWPQLVTNSPQSGSLVQFTGTTSAKASDKWFIDPANNTLFCVVGGVTNFSVKTNGALTAKSYKSVEVAIASSATPSVDWSLGSTFIMTLNVNATFSFSNNANGSAIDVLVSNTGSYTVSWPAGIKWSGGTVPVQTTGTKSDIYSFYQINGVIYGSANQNF